MVSVRTFQLLHLSQKDPEFFRTQRPGRPHTGYPRQISLIVCMHVGIGMQLYLHYITLHSIISQRRLHLK